MVKNTPIPTNYDVILEELKAQVHAARMRAALAANSELVGLYLSIGRKILEQQRREGWGARVISKLADDSLPRHERIFPSQFTLYEASR